MHACQKHGEINRHSTWEIQPQLNSTHCTTFFRSIWLHHKAFKQQIQFVRKSRRWIWWHASSVAVNTCWALKSCNKLTNELADISPHLSLHCIRAVLLLVKHEIAFIAKLLQATLCVYHSDHSTKQEIGWFFAFFPHQQIIFAREWWSKREQPQWAVRRRLHTSISSATKPFSLLYFFCISDKVAARGVFVVVSNRTWCYHQEPQVAPNQPGLKTSRAHLVHENVKKKKKKCKKSASDIKKQTP